MKQKKLNHLDEMSDADLEARVQEIRLEYREIKTRKRSHSSWHESDKIFGKKIVALTRERDYILRLLQERRHQ